MDKPYCKGVSAHLKFATSDAFTWDTSCPPFREMDTLNTQEERRRVDELVSEASESARHVSGVRHTMVLASTILTATTMRRNTPCRIMVIELSVLSYSERSHSMRACVWRLG